MLSVTGFLVLCLYLAFGRYGSVRLGAPGERPEFSTVSWLAMLFAAGMGVGLLFWGVAEPLNHFVGAPGATPKSPLAARRALVLTAFHWGLHAWAVYGLAALVLAYFGFRRKTPYLPGAPIRSAFRGRWVEPVATTADLVAVLAVAFGVAGSMALGILQLHAGLHVVAGVSSTSLWVPVVLLVLMVISYMASAATSLDKGIKWLSNINMLTALVLLLFVAIAGPTSFLLRSFVTAVGDYASSIIGLSLGLYPFQGAAAQSWLDAWTLTYFFWWIAWAPFVGVFVARISRGRTIKQFVLGVLFAPTLFSLLWFAVLGGTGLFEDIYGAGGIARLASDNVTIALFALFDRLPLSSIASGVALALVFIFLVTSVDSATYVLGMLTSRGSLDPTRKRKLAWGISLGLLGGALMLSGSIRAVRAVAVLGAIPFTFIMLLQAVALLRALRTDIAERKQ